MLFCYKKCKERCFIGKFSNFAIDIKVIQTWTKKLDIKKLFRFGRKCSFTAAL